MPSPAPSTNARLSGRITRPLKRWLVRRLIRLFSSQREWREAVHGWNFQQENRPVSDPRVRIGRHTYGVQARSVFMARDDDRLTVGNFCSIAKDVRFIFGNHPLDLVTTYPLRTILRDEWRDNADAVSRGPITVGSDVWIASDAIVLSGVTVGDGAVIGAGAVVTRDVAPYSLAVGSPARHVRYRFSERQIADLRKIRWWDWPDEIILANVDVFYGDVDTFIRRFLPPSTA